MLSFRCLRETQGHAAARMRADVARSGRRWYVNLGLSGLHASSRTPTIHSVGERSERWFGCDCTRRYLAAFVGARCVAAHLMDSSPTTAGLRAPVPRKSGDWRGDQLLFRKPNIFLLAR